GIDGAHLVAARGCVDGRQHLTVARDLRGRDVDGEDAVLAGGDVELPVVRADAARVERAVARVRAVADQGRRVRIADVDRDGAEATGRDERDVPREGDVLRRRDEDVVLVRLRDPDLAEQRARRDVDGRERVARGDVRDAVVTRRGGREARDRQG